MESCFIYPSWSDDNHGLTLSAQLLKPCSEFKQLISFVMCFLTVL